MDSKNWNKKCRIDLPEGLAPGNAAEVVPVDIKDRVDKDIVDIFGTSRRPEIGEERRGRGDHVRTWEARRNAQGTHREGPLLNLL